MACEREGKDMQNNISLKRNEIFYCKVCFLNATYAVINGNLEINISGVLKFKVILINYLCI